MLCQDTKIKIPNVIRPKREQEEGKITIVKPGDVAQNKIVEINPDLSVIVITINSIDLTVKTYILLNSIKRNS